MTKEGGSTKRLGHQICRVVSRGDMLEVDVLALDGIANEMKLDA